MKAVILAGGRGTRISEESVLRPKPMIEIGGHPILWHIMKIYAHAGVTDFVICTGYKGYMIKEYFANYFLHSADVTFDLANNEVTVHREKAEPWRVTVVDTGLDSMTGGRLRRVAAHIQDGPFCLTYGDGVGSIDISAAIAFHRAHGKLATVTSVQPRDRFGLLSVVDGGTVEGFIEKPKGDGKWVNAGFFVLEPGVLDYITDGDATIWERAPLEQLARDGELMAYEHDGFWQAMDTMRDKAYLEELWASEAGAPWKLWGDHDA
ncbi:MAG: glucose-1-phosphate cytidylyltransferase [Rhodobacter sp.]|nr:glucose-1-phosphate cytidylyltransferase [Rhodobacter sp.]